MQLSSRILTALAVLILAVAVVAVRAGSPGTVEAATGTIDVLNVGTCYTTDAEVFEVGACVDDIAGDGYDVAGRDEIVEVGTIFATYAHDPLTAPDNPRGVLYNSNLIKISIADSGRDKRTPILLAAGNAPAANPTICVTEPQNAQCLFSKPDDANTEDVVEKGYLEIIQGDFDGIPLDNVGMRWQKRGLGFNSEFEESGNGVIDGIAIIRGTDPVTSIEATPDNSPYKPMDVADDSLVTFYGRVTPEDGDDAGDDVGEDEEGSLRKLGEFVLDEDVGSGRIDNEDGPDTQEVAPWLSIQKSIKTGASVQLMYIVYHTSEFETLVGDKDGAAYAADADLAKAQPGFSKSEDTDTKLVVEARSDGRVGRQFLRLHETSRFSGRYEGFLKLSDENGDEEGWGLDTIAAASHETRWRSGYRC